MALQDRPRAFGKSDRVYEEAPPGTYAGVLVRVKDEGERPNPFYKEGDKTSRPMKHDVRLSWVITAPMSDGRPFMVSEWMNLYISFGKKKSKLTQHIEMLTGRDVADLDREIDAKSEMDMVTACLGAAGLVTVKRQDNGRSRIAMVSPMPRLPDGSPAMPLPDVGTLLDDVKPLARKGPIIGNEERARIHAAARERATALGGGESLHAQIIADAKAVLGVESAATMPISKVDPMIAAIKTWEPPQPVDPSDEVPF